MRVHFEVFGATRDELEDVAFDAVRKFAPGFKIVDLRIEAFAEVRDFNRIKLWRGEVDAEVEEVER